jgi:hypothetical protein
MLPNFLVLPLAAIPWLAPLSAQVGQSVPSSYVEVGKVPLPQLSSEQWKRLSQMQGADGKPLRLDVTLSVDLGRSMARAFCAEPAIPTSTLRLLDGYNQTGKRLPGSG